MNLIDSIKKAFHWQVRTQGTGKVAPGNLQALENAYNVVNVTEAETLCFREAALGVYKGEPNGKVKAREYIAGQMFTLTQQAGILGVTPSQFIGDFIKTVESNEAKIIDRMEKPDLVKETALMYSQDTTVFVSGVFAVVKDKNGKVLKPKGFKKIKLDD